MKEEAIVINASRGKVIDEVAMIVALEQGKIYGAGLDVFEKEPVAPDNPLLKMDHVVLTPHIGSAIEKTRLDMAMLAAKNIVDYAKGIMPDYIVPELKER